MYTKTTFFRRLTRLLAIPLAIACLLASGARTLADSFTLPEQLIGVTQGFLEFTVEDYMTRTQTVGRYDIQVNNLDPRLRMPVCSQQLDASLESPAQPLGRVTVRVRCDGTSPWTVFVPAQVKLFRDVVVMTRPLKRESVIGEGDVALRERDVSTLGQGFLSELDQAVGMKLLRPTVLDQVLTLQQLEQADVIRKGDHVVITARSGGLSVRMPGEALSKGGLTEQIRVRNLNSQRVVKATVVGPGQVEVAM
ncbi:MULTISPECIES: flagellar basal body P-ring formation chaperone FlgA [Pseudomonas]|uniref:Flagella basal body P-ring formation protein FlgA n=2 Tax=Pseudomonas TaxID=286 RepID=A0A160GRF2_PSEPU|nr:MULTISPECIES: flagellar basal body P-ring formation chaperone FlgA [Pseudomonas]ANC04345.1 flagellar basal body P-ring biosynthesis protein FlgA [Pseudomonas putida]AXA26077.1 flagella basal body P-ring formation protein FlgA [Pseudomonas putida]MEA5672861.1 flagellar basal body P-ring formation chaperone FlgA [Pseudomonas sp. MH2]RSC24908.1 flagella basal body P-ring formation protein FlgA [Pseudomonas putida]RSC29727.1 flagella basal body P-ring formation protein FlgA [Pseudomonas putida]